MKRIGLVAVLPAVTSQQWIQAHSYIAPAVAQESARTKRRIMLSARAIYALLYTLLIAVAIVSAAPNRILMRFGKRTADPVQYRPFVPADYYPVELLGYVPCFPV
ncbi:unnamed protein product [Strongylus vulgaris]|uniref:Uncharacterized protein n=1 Tax=Strongylus vulgaris TaxID=40348 RepID=A0A3P7IZG8_STRVU|nr:unnamed protein product [Strongylus vulgaris]